MVGPKLAGLGRLRSLVPVMRSGATRRLRTVAQLSPKSVGRFSGARSRVVPSSAAASRRSPTRDPSSCAIARKPSPPSSSTRQRARTQSTCCSLSTATTRFAPRASATKARSRRRCPHRVPAAMRSWPARRAADSGGRPPRPVCRCPRSSSARTCETRTAPRAAHASPAPDPPQAGGCRRPSAPASSRRPSSQADPPTAERPP